MVLIPSNMPKITAIVKHIIFGELILVDIKNHLLLIFFSSISIITGDFSESME